MTIIEEMRQRIGDGGWRDLDDEEVVAEMVYPRPDSILTEFWTGLASRA